MPNKTAFVTGGTGFIGQNLVEHLTQSGWEVIALHRPELQGDGVAEISGPSG